MKILHFPFHFDLNSLGGTEIYVHSLSKELNKFNILSEIAAPTNDSNLQGNVIEFEGIRINYFECDKNQTINHAYGYPDIVALNNIKIIIKNFKPDIIHLHAKTSAISYKVIEFAKLTHIKVVFTYHTPTVTCANGTMMINKNLQCNGKLDLKLCTKCVYNSNQLGRIQSWFLSNLPHLFLNFISKFVFIDKFKKGFILKSLISTHHFCSKKILEQSDLVIAVCDWVYKVIELNFGNSLNKLVLIRQGLVAHPTTVYLNDNSLKKDILYQYYGRIDYTKGILEFIKAFSMLPDYSIKLEVYPIISNINDPYVQGVLNYCDLDKRIIVKNSIPAHQVSSNMTKADYIVVPSIWLETGPLVVLEAFSAKTPIIGTNLGGIKELVINNFSGILIDDISIEGWIEAIKNSILMRDELKSNCNDLSEVRTMYQVAKEMIYHYRNLINIHL